MTSSPSTPPPSYHSVYNVNEGVNLESYINDIIHMNKKIKKNERAINQLELKDNYLCYMMCYITVFNLCIIIYYWYSSMVT